jgi:uncharacterized protein
MSLQEVQMKNYLHLIITAFLLFLTNTAAAFEPPVPTGYVVDMADKLSQDQIKDLNVKLKNISDTTSNQFAALIIPSLNGESIDDVAYKTFNTWKVGKAGLDNGVLIVIAVAERKSRIETGKGVGGDLTDLQSNDILRQQLGPHLRKGEFFEGLNASFDAINGTIESRKHPVPQPVATSHTDPALIAIGIITFGIIILSIIIILTKEAKKEKGRFDNRNKKSNDKYNDVESFATGAAIGYVAAKATSASPPRRRESSLSPVVAYDIVRDTYRAPAPSYDSSSSSSSNDSGGGFDFGGGFGGGSSGGGGSDSDW